MRTKSKRRQTSSFCLLDVFMRSKMMSFVLLFAYVCFVLFYAKQATFFLLDVFYAHLKQSFFLFACVRFVLLVGVRFFHKRYKTPLIPSFTILLTQTPKATKQISDFLPLDVFYAHLKLSLFSFAYVCFCALVSVNSF